MTPQAGGAIGRDVVHRGNMGAGFILDVTDIAEQRAHVF